MTEDTPAPAELPQPTAEPPRPAAEPPVPDAAPRKRKLPGVLVLVGFVITAAGGAWLFQQQQDLAARLQPPPSVAPARVAALESRLDTLQQRLAQLEQRPAATPDLTALEARLGQVAARVDALQGSDAGLVQALAGKVQTLEQRLAQTEQHEQAAVRLARLQAAGVALAAGQALGDIPGAPPALAKFAAAAPPTEGALRSSFPVAAGAAEQASLPSTAGLSLAARMWQRVESLVTVQQGSKVLVGPPASHVLAQARARLDDGDLAGAVGALDQLDPAAAKAMAGWRTQAQSLLDARAALAGMVRS
jgi:hypothetical protein